MVVPVENKLSHSNSRAGLASITLMRKPLVQALAWALLGAAVWQPHQVVQAQTVVQAAGEEISLNVPAGSLDEALSEFGRQAGVQIVVNAEVTAGLSSQGVSGRMSVASGLHRLLAGTGLEAMQGARGGYTLRKAAGVASLEAVRVTGEWDATTEGTGSYTAAGPSSTATGLDLSLRETPQSVTVVTRQKMEDFNLQTLADVIDQTPGLFVNRQASIITFHSRGEVVDNFQVNGMRQTSGAGQSPQNDDMATIDRVEVLKGSAGLLQGDGNPSATINLIRKKPTREFMAHMKAGGGSWDSYNAEIDVSGPVNESGTVRSRAVAAYSNAHSYRDGEKSKGIVLFGTVDIDLSESTLLNIGLDYRKREQYGNAGSYSFQKYGMWGEVHDTQPVSWNAAAPWAGGNLYVLSTFASLEHQFGNGWQASLKLGHNRRRQPSTWFGYAGSSTYFDMGKGSNELDDTKNAAVEIKGPFELFGRTHEVVAGYNWMRTRSGSELQIASSFASTQEYIDFRSSINYSQDGGKNMPQPGDAYLEPFSSTRSKSTHRGGYLAGRFSLRDDLSLLAGARVSDYKSHTDNLNASGLLDNQTGFNETGVVTPYAGLVFDVNSFLSLYGSYTSIFQPVTVQDEQGRILDPKEGVTYEIGAKTELLDGRLNASIAQFWKRWEKAYERSGGFAPNGDPAYRNVNNVMEHGYEIELSGELAPGWQAQGSYVMNSSEIESSRLPKHQFKLSTSYSFSGRLAGLTVGAAARWQSPIQSRERAPHTTQDAYWVFDAMARYRVDKHWSVSMNIANVFDKKYLYVYNLAEAYLGQYQSWGAPRSFNLSMCYQF